MERRPSNLIMTRDDVEKFYINPPIPHALYWFNYETDEEDDKTPRLNPWECWHEFPDTGTLRSYCKLCHIIGVYDREKQKYVAEQGISKTD